MNIVRVIRGLALTGLASLGLVTSANAQNNVDVDIVIGGGGIAILNYYSAIEVNIDSADLADLVSPTCSPTAGIANCDEGSSGSLTATAGGGGLTADGNLTVSGGADLSAVNLDLDNVWAVRSIGGGPNTTVSVALGGGTSLSNGSSAIDVNDVLVYSDSVATPGASVQFADPGLSSNNAERGGIRLELDLSGAAVEGTYSAASSTYTITVSNT